LLLNFNNNFSRGLRQKENQAALIPLPARSNKIQSFCPKNRLFALFTRAYPLNKMNIPNLSKIGGRYNANAFTGDDPPPGVQ
jgi:hypothetical protein